MMRDMSSRARSWFAREREKSQSVGQ